MNSCDILRQVGWDSPASQTPHRETRVGPSFSLMLGGPGKSITIIARMILCQSVCCCGAVGIGHFSHTLDFNCYLYSKGNLLVDGKSCPSVNIGSIAW